MESLDQTHSEVDTGPPAQRSSEDAASGPRYSFWILCLTTLLVLPNLLLARLASWSKINRTRVDSTSVTKTRRWYANLLRLPGNVVLRFRKVPLCVLSTKHWHQREALLNNAKSDGTELTLKLINGIALNEYLELTDSADERFAAVTTAMRSLFDFHLQFNESHGDASVSNVMIYELQDGTLSATWFDFDVAHLDSCSMLSRRSDDLRALIFTAKRWLKSEQFVELFSGWDVFYPDETVWLHLQKAMGNPLYHCDIFHQAQLLRSRRHVD